MTGRKNVALPILCDALDVFFSASFIDHRNWIECDG